MDRGALRRDLPIGDCLSAGSLPGCPQPVARHIAFLSFWILSIILLRVPINSLISLALHDERYTTILLIPAISAFLVWLRRKQIFLASPWRPGVGIPLLLIGILLEFGQRFWPLFPPGNGGLSVAAVAIILVWTALFVLCYGMQALNSASFAFLFLLLMIPLPLGLLDRIILALQKGSADISYGLFKLIRVPVFRNGFLFSLPGIEIEVAKECSGIRSGLSIVITAILAGHFFLRSGWNQLWFVIVAIPVVIFKNAVRIVTISWLGVYINLDFFYGRLHRQGGLPFSLLAFAILFVILRVLQKAEVRSEKPGISLGHQPIS